MSQPGPATQSLDPVNQARLPPSMILVKERNSKVRDKRDGARQAAPLPLLDPRSKCRALVALLTRIPALISHNFQWVQKVGAAVNNERTSGESAAAKKPRNIALRGSLVSRFCYPRTIVSQTKTVKLFIALHLSEEAPVGIEPTNGRFAVSCLTTWPRRRLRGN